MKGELVKREDRWDLYGSDGAKIASSVENPFGKLSIRNCEYIENGYDLDYLTNYLFYSVGDDAITNKHSFKVGFQKAIELLGDKKFSVEDIQNVIDSNDEDLVYQTVSENGDLVLCLDEDVLIQSLQKKEWIVEIVTKPYTEVSEGFNLESKREFKLDENNCLILKPIKNV